MSSVNAFSFGKEGRRTILAYHGIAECPPEDDPDALFLPAETFRRQLDYLSRQREVVPLHDILHRQRFQRPAVALTFDDGYESVASVAGPMLAERGFAATVFVPTKWIGRRNEWDPASNAPVDVMSAEQLRALRQLGIDVESHGHAHIDMSIARPDDLRADLALSIEEIERITGARPRFLSYPFGASSATAESIAAEMGFEAAFSVNRRDGGRYAAARVPAVRSDSAALFRLKTSGVYPAIRFSTAGTVAVRVYRRLDRSAA